MSPRAAAAATPSIDVPIHRFELSCGATLLVSPRAGSPVTALAMHLRGGRSLDPEGREGMAYLTGALLDQGSKKRTEAQIAEALETAGGGFSGDANGVTGNVASRNVKGWLELFTDLITTPAYPVPLVRRQKGRLLDRMRIEEDDPRVQADRLFRGLVYGDHWLGRPSRGTIDSLSQVQSNQLTAFHRRNWVGSRATIGICGDVDPEATRRFLSRRLAAWDPGTPLPVPEPDFPAPAVRVGAFEADRQQVHLYVGHLGIPRRHPDYAALTVMDHVLGTGPGFTNRISKRLRDELGLAYTVHAAIYNSAGVLPGTFTAYIGTSPEHVPTALEGFLREIRRIQDKPVTQKELSTAKDYLVGSFALSFQRASRRAGYLVSSERHGFGPDHLRTLPAEFAAVTAADVRRVARTHLHPTRICVAAGGPIRPTTLARATRAAIAALP